MKYIVGLVGVKVMEYGAPAHVADVYSAEDCTDPTGDAAAATVADDA
jgi:hypothetical protein